MLSLTGCPVVTPSLFSFHIKITPVAANHLSSAGRRGTKAEEEVVCDPAVEGVVLVGSTD